MRTTFVGALVGVALLGPTHATAQEAARDWSVIVAPEVARDLSTSPLEESRWGLRIEAVFPGGLAPYVTVGRNEGGWFACPGSCSDPEPPNEIVDLVGGINYRPELGEAPVRPYLGAGYGIFQYMPGGNTIPNLDIHGGLELRAGPLGMRAELRRMAESEAETFGGTAFVFSLVAEF